MKLVALLDGEIEIETSKKKKIVEVALHQEVMLLFAHNLVLKSRQKIHGQNVQGGSVYM